VALRFGPARVRERLCHPGAKRIMTTPIVIGWAKQLVVKRYQDPHPYPAHVVFAGPRL